MLAEMLRERTGMQRAAIAALQDGNIKQAINLQSQVNELDVTIAQERQKDFRKNVDWIVSQPVYRNAKGEMEVEA